MKFALLSALCCMLLPAAFARNKSAQNEAQNEAQTKPQNGMVPDDRTISFLVGEAIREDPRVWSANIDISTKDGVVSLSGNVDSLLQRRFAGMVASKIRGVVNVANELDVLTVPRADEQIASEIDRRLRMSSALKIRNLNVRCEAGTVTLSGEVESPGYRTEADLMASEVSGVRAVKNALKIRATTRRADAELSEELRNTFFRDVYLTDLRIDVECKNSNVVLRGVVGNAYLRTRAGQLARNTTGVMDVLNEIRINRLFERGERREEASPTNEELAEAVSTRLSSDVRIDATNIEVGAHQGQVTLRGHVPSMSERQLAEFATRQVTGAVWTTNLLSVRAASRSDVEILRDVTRLLEDDSYVRRLPISADVLQGVVTLRGAVSSHLPRMRAAELSGRVKGVRGVRNEIEVRWKSLFRDPTLKQHVESRLRANWETTNIVKSINVSVTNGNVVLTGDVATWAQRREAGRMAFFTSGVRSVQNRLTIKGVRYPWDDWNSEGSDIEPPPSWIHDYRGDFLERPGVIRL